ncbi:MAG: NAD-dependent epimerase/dehydratase family protein, partial [Gammaproteobacteria bacterium]|nr:NAD-dependent epimerase/dehydratase family protein [Gammaproteobacteria bacterium]
MRRTAVVLGGTGLIGRHLCASVADSPAWEKVIAVVRRRDEKLPARIEQRIVPDFTRLADALLDVAAEDLFICIGTTRKQAGSKEAFRRVDLEYPLAAARTLMLRDLEHVLVISALGADLHSPFFYNQVKGRLEAELQALPVGHLTVFRPSLLLGERQSARPLERISGQLGQWLGRLLGGAAARWAPVDAEVVAQSMLTHALDVHRQKSRP